MSVVKMKTKTTGSCYESHPPLEIDEGLFIYGGNCATPVVKDADVYVALDMSGASNPMQYPWHDPVAFYFRIVDMGVPKSLPEFKALLTWLAIELQDGKKIHIGCIGGHGRTGMVLAALRNELTGDPDAIQFVRDHYCKKAVESKEQINYLHKHWGINKVKPTKGYGGGFKSYGSKEPSYWQSKQGSLGFVESDEDFLACSVPTTTSVWGKKIKR